MKLNKGQSTVTQGGWGVSGTTGTGIHGCILHIYRSKVFGFELPVNRWLRGLGDGRLFPSYEAAHEWALDHGYLKPYFTAPDLRARRKARAYNPKQTPKGV